jgi:hypothetical protein
MFTIQQVWALVQQAPLVGDVCNQKGEKG